MTIEELQLHDAPLTGLHINFEKSIIILSYLTYEEETNNYNRHELHFIDVRKISVDFPECQLKEDDAEINSMDIEPICTGNTRIKFLFLFGFSQPSGELKFEYSNVKIKLNIATLPLP